ncbi:ATP-binding cassette domain-containing protein [Mucilaginibacter conchicola]|uniref:ATP-binding cassette domain-containing protein n=1 Tax=Mucilaginibacter conchicola TaxID=2303333 RepID=A0A372NUT3_9SPHI|nr:ATP-binding cassette domain-containing protein [Mucilaginibacter conchicola]RFZ92986.1 ATP-binding cassette domain-containing protein [Mucilaginibacter conchicola]
MIRVDIKKQIGRLEFSLNKTFGDGITLISGPSGAGKTTLLKMIAGLIKPDEGIIAFNNLPWFDSRVRINVQPQYRKIGFVFQDYALFPNMSVRQHLEYATTDIAWIERLLKLGRLENFATQRPHQLSGGQQQRLAILRALAIKPQLILMDEPFSALDQKTKTTLIAELQIIFKELKVPILIVSHNPQDIAGIYDDEMAIE